MTTKRKEILDATRRQVLMEAGYRCVVPRCRNILAIDIHHIVEVSEDGGNDSSNLLALCPTCHALYHRGTITKDAIYSWKGMVVALGHAFDQETIDNLLFLHKLQVGDDFLLISGDGVLKFARLIGAGLATFRADFRISLGPEMADQGYTVKLTGKGQMLIEAWFNGNRDAVKDTLSDATDEK